MSTRAARAGPPLGAAILLWAAADEAPASIVAPPDVGVAARLFVEACWQGLRAPGVFREAVRNSDLRFQRIEDSTPGLRFGGRRTHIDYRANARCTVRFNLVSVDAAEQVVEQVSRLTALQAVAFTEGDSERTRTYRWTGRPDNGGRVYIQAIFTPPPPRRFRMYPAGFDLTISAYLAPSE